MIVVFQRTELFVVVGRKAEGQIETLSRQVISRRQVIAVCLLLDCGRHFEGRDVMKAEGQAKLWAVKWSCASGQSW